MGDQVPRPAPSTMEGGPRPLDPAARDDTPLGRGILLSQSRDGHKSRIDHLPDTCTFIRACFQSFHELQVSQDSTLLTHESIGEPLWRNNRSAIAASTEPLPKNGPTISTPTESATSSAQAASSPPINGTTPSSDTRPTAASPTHGLMNANESDPSSSATSRPPSSARLTHPPPHSKTATSSSLSTRRCTPNATRDTRRAQTEDPTPSPSSVDRHDRLPTRDWQDAPHRRPEGHHARRPLDRHQQALQATLRRR